MRPNPRIFLPSVFLTFLGLSTPVFAQLDAATTEAFCQSLARVAIQIPQARDAHTPLSAVVATMRHELQEQLPPRVAGKVDTFLTALALQVYANPRLTVDGTQRLVGVLCTAEFATDVILGSHRARD